MRAFTVDYCEQRSPEWFAAHAGLLSASDAAAMMSRLKRSGEEPVGKTELRLRLALETIRGVALAEDGYDNHWMRRGRELEAAGVASYEAITGEIVQTVGFLRSTTLPIGCSPDGIIGDFEGGLELKCPKFTTHWEYLSGNRLPPEYQWQVVHSLFVSGLPFWDFCSYCPEFEGDAQLFRFRVWRDSVDLDAYALAFALFWTEVAALTETLRARSGMEVAHA